MGGVAGAPRALRVGAAWVGGCAALQLLFAAALRRAAAARPRSRLAALTPAERGTVANTAVAAVHAVCLFAGSVAFLAPRIDIRAAGPLLVPITSLEPMEADAAFWASAMLGYLAYDLGYNAVFAAAGLSKDMAAHHALGAYSWLALLAGDVGGIYIMWVHAAEGSTPFLHVCWILHKLGADGSALYRLSAALLLAMFFLCRVVAAPLCLASLWAHRALWGAAPLRRALFGGQLLIMLFFVALNYFWFAQLLKRALRPARRSGAKGAAAGPDAAMAPQSARDERKRD